MSSTPGKFRIKIFADGANLEDMVRAYRSGIVQGFTTNPTLMRKAGVVDYESFARKVLGEITELPISFEVFSDELDEMVRQARKIAAWASNVYVKIPVTNTRGEPTVRIIKSLSREGIKLNITAILTLDQVRQVTDSLAAHTPAIVSVFAGWPEPIWVKVRRPVVIDCVGTLEGRSQDLAGIRYISMGRPVRHRS